MAISHVPMRLYPKPPTPRGPRYESGQEFNATMIAWHAPFPHAQEGKPKGNSMA
jgi:hypothetical protein